MNDSDFVTLRGGLQVAMPRSLDQITHTCCASSTTGLKTS